MEVLVVEGAEGETPPIIRVPYWRVAKALEVA